jgi:hypothetical protein
MAVCAWPNEISKFEPGEGQKLKGFRECFLAAEGRTKVRNEFRVKESARGYRVELFRDGEPYVTFMDGLTREGAEREARSLTALWARISVAHPMRAPILATEKAASVPRLHASRHIRVGDWT